MGSYSSYSETSVNCCICSICLFAVVMESDIRCIVGKLLSSVSMVGKRRCSEEGSRKSEARVTAAELSASEQPTDHRRSPGKDMHLFHNIMGCAVAPALR